MNPGVTWSLVQQILLEDLGMRKVTVKFVPWLLTVQQKEGSVEACCALREQSQTAPDFFSKIITSDKTCCYGFDTETKQQSTSQWTTATLSRQRKGCQMKSNI